MIAEHRKRSAPKLDLDDEEREAIQGAGVPLRRLAECEAAALAAASGLPAARCRELVALARFQTLGSVGPESARDLWRLGFRSLEELDGADPAAMYRRMSALAGRRVDPCVEDVFRCAVAQVLYPDLPEELRQWWTWSDQRGEAAVTLPPRPGSG